jgi:hypothetical protein
LGLQAIIMVKPDSGYQVWPWLANCNLSWQAAVAVASRCRIKQLGKRTHGGVHATITIRYSFD